MADIETLATIVAPLLTAGVTLLLWGLLVVIQTPRPYWKDALNRSIAGLLITLAIFIVLIALEAAGVPHVNALETRALICLAGLFALVGLPRTYAELKQAIARELEGN